MTGYNIIDLQTRADAGDPQALVDLAEYFAGNTGIPLNDEKARDLYEKAAIAGNREGQFWLGRDYCSGCRFDEAVSWLTLAADQSHSEAQLLLSDIYLKGPREFRNLELGLHWLAAAADSGSPDAQYGLGKLFYSRQLFTSDSPASCTKGVTGTLNDMIGKYWFRRAASQDHSKAGEALHRLEESERLMKWRKPEMNLWERMIADAESNRQDGQYKAACLWLESAARGGHRESMFLFGILNLYSGKLRIAGQMFEKASSLGHPAAGSFLRMLDSQDARELTESEIIRGNPPAPEIRREELPAELALKTGMTDVREENTIHRGYEMPTTGVARGTWI